MSENIKLGLTEKTPIPEQPGHKRDKVSQVPKGRPPETASRGGKTFKIK